MKEHKKARAKLELLLAVLPLMNKEDRYEILNAANTVNDGLRDNPEQVTKDYVQIAIHFMELQFSRSS